MRVVVSLFGSHIRAVLIINSGRDSLIHVSCLFIVKFASSWRVRFHVDTPSLINLEFHHSLVYIEVVRLRHLACHKFVISRVHLGVTRIGWRCVFFLRVS